MKIRLNAPLESISRKGLYPKSLDFNKKYFLGDENGKYYSDCRRKEPAVQAQNDEDAKKLWQISEKLTGLAQN